MATDDHLAKGTTHVDKTDTKPLEVDSAELIGIISVKDGSHDGLDTTDDAVLRAQGHEAAMPRNFSMLSALGLAFR